MFVISFEAIKAYSREKSIQAQLIEFDLLLMTETAGISQSEPFAAIECISESNQICDNSNDQVPSEIMTCHVSSSLKWAFRCAIKWSLINEISFLGGHFKESFPFLAPLNYRVRNVNAKKCLNFILSLAGEGMSSRLYLISTKTWAANLFILTLKLSFDDIQIGPRIFSSAPPLNTHEMYTQKNIFRGLHEMEKTQNSSRLVHQLSQSQFTEFLWI